jgi:DNA helicase-2/ATP-dependent DNA helicase PcrA
MKLSDEQQAIVDLAAGKHLVLAPAGSGKTELLARRVAAALAGGRAPARMASLTFTNRAARNMVERTSGRSRDGGTGSFIGNFHAFSMHVLRGDRVMPVMTTLLDEEDQSRLVEDAVEELLAGADDAALSLRADPSWLAFPVPRAQPVEAGKREELSRRAGSLLPDYSEAHTLHRLGLGGDLVRSVTRRLSAAIAASPAQTPVGNLVLYLDAVHASYQRLKRETAAVDFSDLLVHALAHLRSEPAVREKWRMEWVQVDEVQDLNAIQWALLHAISGPESHLVLFGDREQSIFSFMGGDLKRLDAEVAGFQTHRLSANYRSLGGLLGFFKRYAAHNLGTRLEIQAAGGEAGQEGGEVELMPFADGDAELGVLTEAIRQRREDDPDCRIAVLLRTNRDVDEVSRALGEFQHFVVGQTDVFRLRVVKDFMAMLTCLQSREKRLPWSRMLHLFGGVPSLREARVLTNRMFAAGFRPHEFAAGDGGLADRFLAAMTGGRVVVFDTETTGLDLANDDIIQVAAVEVVGGKPGRSLELLLRTDRPLGDSAAVHGIDAERLARDGQPRAAAWRAFFDFVGGAPLIAHNIRFDGPVLRANLARDLPGHVFANRLFCTLELSRRLLPGRTSYQLFEMLADLGLEGENTHDALDDALAAANLAIALTEHAAEGDGVRRELEASAAVWLGRFRERFGRFWQELLGRRDEAVPPGELFTAFVNAVPGGEAVYQKDHLAEARGKLIRHMTADYRGDLLGRWLRATLPAYQACRESDLILPEDRLVISTVHRAKGLEFDHVYIPRCSDDRFPIFFAARSNDKYALAEEARMLYVAITRARRGLTISWPLERSGPYGRSYPAEPSRFLVGLPEFPRTVGALERA